MIDITKLEPEKKEQFVQLLRDTGSSDRAVASVAQKAFAGALTTPLRQGIVVGDIVSDIFTPTVFDPAARIEYPIDFFRPDNAGEFRAFVIPNQGNIPNRLVEGDYVTVPTYDIGAGIDFLARYAKEARWDIVSRALEVLEAGFVKKKNDDGWHTILAAGYDRNIIVNDANAAAGQFTKRLVSVMKLVMRRNGGGNSASINRAKMTDLYLSPESSEDIRNFTLADVDDFTRREIFVSTDDNFASMYDVAFHAIDELGEGQEYQDYYQNVTALGAANNGMVAGDLELVIGLDLSKNDSFVNPIRDPLVVQEDPTEARSRRISYYGWLSCGFACLSSLRVLLGSL